MLSMESARSAFTSAPSALSVGLLIFMTLFELINLLYPLTAALMLTPNALFELDLNRLSFYPLVHLNILHLIFNCWALYPLINQFEQKNGTVRTGIVLNLFAFLPGVVYCILAKILPLGAVAGSSGWWFAFLGYTTLRQSANQPTIQFYQNFIIPTWSIPFVPLVVFFVLIPSSSWMGHLLGLLAGWALEQGYLAKLVEPSTNVVEWIENKLAPLIARIPFGLKFIGEVEAREIRAQHQPSPIPLSTVIPSSNPNFNGPGHVVGA